MACERMKLGGYCTLDKTAEECPICERNREIYESRKMASYVEKMNDETDLHRLNELYHKAEKTLYEVYCEKFNRLTQQVNMRG